MSVVQAKDFMISCFRPGETIALLLRRETVPHVRQRIVTREQAVSHRYLGWLSHENRNGANVYIAANPIRPGSRKRTKESVAEVRHLYLDIDQEGEARIAAVRASTEVPIPSIVLSTSPSKFQVLWKVEGFSSEQQEHMLKLLSLSFGGDSACTDCNRVLRIPGFANLKYAPAHLVTAEYLSDGVYTPEHFRLQEQIAPAMPFRHANGLHPSNHKRTQSEADWAWVLAELRSGTDAVSLTASLAARRCDKANPLYYAQRTIDLASARLALLEGTAPETVAAMLEDRRSAEFSLALCSARAREITQTAARMIARHKIA